MTRQEILTQIDRLEARLDTYRIANQMLHPTALEIIRDKSLLETQLAQFETRETRQQRAGKTIGLLKSTFTVLDFLSGGFFGRDPRTTNILGKNRRK